MWIFDDGKIRFRMIQISWILPLDLKARVAVVSDSAEAIVKLVADSPDIIGLLPRPAVPLDLTIIPVTLPSLTLDVHLEARKPQSSRLRPPPDPLRPISGMRTHSRHQFCRSKKNDNLDKNTIDGNQ